VRPPSFSTPIRTASGTRPDRRTPIEWHGDGKLAAVAATHGGTGLALARAIVMQLFPPAIGRYELLLPIAPAGESQVYLAKVAGGCGIDPFVALKVAECRREGASHSREALLEEARITGRIRHANVVSVIDAGEAPHGVFLVMHYVEGISLAELLGGLRGLEREMPVEVALSISDDILAGLQAAHEQCGIVHRDLTPRHVLVGLDGVARVGGFGSAKPAASEQTRYPIPKGNLAHMSPEQAQGRALDCRSDVWSAGTIVWELLARRPLYREQTATMLLLRIVAERAPRICDVRRELPASVGTAIAKALEPDPRERHASARDFARALGTSAKRSGIPIARHSEVADFVAPVAGEMVEQRRRRALEVQAIQGQLKALVASPRGELWATR
jgi:eukaryotic-like serine/threonine-protein kinase